MKIINDDEFLNMLESIKCRCIFIGCSKCLYAKNQECVLFEYFPEHWDIDKKNNKIKLINY